jgi:hypothetical protein
MRVYRLWRDDPYLRHMLALLEQLQVGAACWAHTRAACQALTARA